MATTRIVLNREDRNGYSLERRAGRRNRHYWVCLDQHGKVIHKATTKSDCVYAGAKYRMTK